MSRLRRDVVVARVTRAAALAGTLLGFGCCVAAPLLRREGESPAPDGIGVLEAAPAYFALATFVNGGVALRRVGASRAGAATAGAFGAVLAAMIAWLLIFWMRLDGGAVWRAIGWTGLALLLLGNLGVGRWAASVRQLPGSPANFHVGL